MTEGDEKRLAGLRMRGGDVAFLLRLLDSERAENAQLVRVIAGDRDFGKQLLRDIDALTARATQAETDLAAAREVVREYVEAARGIGNTYFSPTDAWAAGERHRIACDKLHELAALTPETP